jgi:sugar O-acyltransferase (sialic acid O-acetyltransferase NeuD family)
MNKVIIFGSADTAELAHFYLTHDSDYEVVAFCVDEKFITLDTFKNLPVIAFESIEINYPVNEYLFFAPMTATKMNKNRQRVYDQAKEKGYKLISYISSKATVFPGTTIGDNCFILENNTIQPYTSIGNNVVLWSGNHIGHHSRIDDHVFFTSHVVMSGHCHVKSYCFLGVNSTLRDGLTIEKGSLIAMGASVLKSTKEWGVYTGNPAKLRQGVRSSNVF